MAHIAQHSVLNSPQFFGSFLRIQNWNKLFHTNFKFLHYFKLNQNFFDQKKTNKYNDIDDVKFLHYITKLEAIEVPKIVPTNVICFTSVYKKHNAPAFTGHFQKI